LARIDLTAPTDCESIINTEVKCQPDSRLKVTRGSAGVELHAAVTFALRLYIATARRGLGKSRDGIITIQVGDKAPLFNLRDAAGNEYSLAEELRKGPVIAAFFKISCPVCQFTFPFLERLFKMYGANAATFLAISQDDALDTREFCVEYGITFPVLLDDESYTVSNLYGLTNVPSIFLIGADGIVKVTSIGFDKTNLEKISSELAAITKRPSAELFRPEEVVPSFKPG
jgi:peroxiredoxin